MFFQERMNTKVSIYVLVINEWHLFQDSQAQTLLQLYLKKRHFSGPTEDTFFKLKNNCYKDGK